MESSRLFFEVKMKEKENKNMRKVICGERLEVPGTGTYLSTFFSNRKEKTNKIGFRFILLRK